MPLGGRRSGFDACFPKRRKSRKGSPVAASSHNEGIISSVLAERRIGHMGNLPRIAILGAGPAGLGAAWRLARQNKADAVVIEQRDDVGGNSGSFDLDGLQVYYGSHRLHPSCRPEILSDLREL